MNKPRNLSRSERSTLADIDLFPRLAAQFGAAIRNSNMNSNAPSMTTDSHDWSIWRVMLAYGLTAVVFIGLIWAVLVYGQSLTPAVASNATETAAKAAGATHKLSPLYHVLLALVSIL